MRQSKILTKADLRSTLDVIIYAKKQYQIALENQESSEKLLAELMRLITLADIRIAVNDN